jgi:hypothetical protein
VLKNHAAETYGLVEVQFLALLTLALAGGKWSSSCCVHFTPRDIFWFVVLRRLGEPQKNHSRQIGKEKTRNQTVAIHTVAITLLTAVFAHQILLMV